MDLMVNNLVLFHSRRDTFGHKKARVFFSEGLNSSEFTVLLQKSQFNIGQEKHFSPYL